VEPIVHNHSFTHDTRPHDAQCVSLYMNVIVVAAERTRCCVLVQDANMTHPVDVNSNIL
jgi:hypothetical protein